MGSSVGAPHKMFRQPLLYIRQITALVGFVISRMNFPTSTPSHDFPGPTPLCAILAEAVTPVSRAMSFTPSARFTAGPHSAA